MLVGVMLNEEEVRDKNVELCECCRTVSFSEAHCIEDVLRDDCVLHDCVRTACSNCAFLKKKL